MFCTECGANIDGARFCPSCGKPVQQMNIQPSKCSNCGAELQEGTKFCNQCGTPVGAVNSKTSLVQAAQPMQAEEQARQSWKLRQTEQENQAKQAREAWQAKLNQGNAQQGQSSIQPKEPSAVTQKSTVQPQPKTRPQPMAQPQPKVQTTQSMAHPQKEVQKNQTEKGQMVQQAMKSAAANLASAEAASTPGEVGFDLGMIPSMDSVHEVLSPVSALLNGAKGFFSGIFGMLKKPWKLIPFAVIVILWVSLWNRRMSSDDTIEFLSWLTFTEGGMYRDGTLGIIGGYLGKGVTAAALGSVFFGGIPAFFKGIPGVFKSLGKGRSIVAIIIGAIVGAALYVAFAGYEEACSDTAMAGIAGVMISLEAMGRKNSWLYKMAVSVTAKARDGVKTIRENAANGLFTGMAAGFAVATIILWIRG